MYAVPAAQWPSIAATWGTTPDSVTCSRNSAPGAGEGRPARGLDARAGRVEQPHDRDALAQRELAHARRLVLADRAHRAGHHREVVGADGDAAAVDLADAGDHAVGRQVAALLRRARGPSSRRAGRTRRTCRDRAARSIRSRTGGLPRLRWRSMSARPAHAERASRAVPRGRRRSGFQSCSAGSSATTSPSIRAGASRRRRRCPRGVLGLRGDGEQRVQVAQRIGRGLVPDRVEGVAAELHERGRLRSERRRQLVDGGVELVDGHDTGHEADAVGLGGVDAAAGHHQLERLLRRHRPHERDRDHERPQPDVDLGRAELRVVGGDHQVARERQTEAAGEGVAAHPGDRGLAELPHVLEQPASSPRPSCRSR